MGTFLRIDVRRPASWIALAMGGWLGWWSGTEQPMDGAVAIVAAALSVVAAIGDLPLSIGIPAVRWLPVLWACERVAWPLFGAVLCHVAIGGATELPFIQPAVWVGVLWAGGTVVGCRLAETRAADAASLTLLAAAASGAVGGWFAPPPARGWFGAALVWSAVGGLGWVWSRSQLASADVAASTTPGEAPLLGADGLYVDALPARGPVRHALTRLAMVAALAAMAGWLAIEQRADGAMAWAMFTIASFVGLAVPRATLQDGMAGVGAWDRLCRTAASGSRSSARSRWRLAGWRPGATRWGGGVVASEVAILGWPILVCAVLSLNMPSSALVPLSILAGLMMVAAVVATIVSGSVAIGLSRETALAVSLALVLGGLTVFAATTSFGSRAPRVGRPSLPSLLMPSAEAGRVGRLGGVRRPRAVSATNRQGSG